MKNLFHTLHKWTENSPPLTRRQFLGAFAAMFAMLTLALVGEALLLRANHHRIAENRQRLVDIQESRLFSCKTTYLSFPKEFKPFFPKKRKNWTAQNKHDYAKLLKVSRHLARIECPKQVNPKVGRVDGPK